MSWSRRAPRTRAVHVLLVLSIAVLVLFPRGLRATVEEQRARLPPPATCQDPVEGVWMSHKFDENYGDWYVFTLRIRRVQSGQPLLTGDIQSHFWDGGPGDAEPGPCRPGASNRTVYMTAQGTESGGRIEFWGTAWRPDQVFCGPPLLPGQYNLDHFSGTIDPALQEFQSVNNDGGRSINDPTVFRRVRCLEPPPPASVNVTPPPLAPPRRAGGCSRSLP